MEKVNFETFCADPQLLGEPISKGWATFYKIVEGLSLDDEGVELYRQCAGRDRYEPRAYTEATGICGRRAEKTSTGLKYLLWKSQVAGWERHGSWFTRTARRLRLLRIPLIAQDLRVARDVKRMAESLVLGSPVLSKEVADIRVSEIVFRNGIAFTIFPASKASVRGLTCPAALLDELAWVSIDGASDIELVRQVRPAMIQFGESRRLLKMSTPWQKSGVIYDEFSKRAERPDLLVWQASTATMTSRISAEELERERATDPVYYAREYEAQFTDDLEAFLPVADIQAAVARWKEQPPRAEPFYVAALDASGLTGGDRFTFGIAHGESGVVVDALRGWRRAAVPHVCDEIATMCKAYRIASITADQYSFSFLSELMRQRGLVMEQLAFSARSKPEIFFDLKSALAQGQFQIPDHPEAIRELRALESTRTSGGNYKISAPRGQHDDYACVLALIANRIKRCVGREPMIEYITAPRPATDAELWNPYNDYGFGPPRRHAGASFSGSRPRRLGW